MVPSATRLQVRQRAKFLCEYCHSPEYLSPDLFTLDHLQPRSLGGSDQLNNLALACHRCNERRYNFTKGVDPVTENMVPLFNPRRQSWADHFMWSRDTLRILGTSSTGRATCQRLDLNDDFRDEPSIQVARSIWVSAGWHPPEGDPIESWGNP
ncbi:HNH endonuclease [Nodosilinea sp. P-1105]|uniref:HNH endonuclease n=1 Tax=Nodosilinea sp. P-1105 TaxID=2546229 RepID=UPI00146F8A90|nr:HNH endonuclease [Nodosilinea sp. P-1105]NMF86688.1 HNH endonuclease [Nodosilinea sp. P-1105]